MEMIGADWLEPIDATLEIKPPIMKGFSVREIY